MQNRQHESAIGAAGLVPQPPRQIDGLNLRLSKLRSDFALQALRKETVAKIGAVFDVEQRDPWNGRFHGAGLKPDSLCRSMVHGLFRLVDRDAQHARIGIG